MSEPMLSQPISTITPLTTHASMELDESVATTDSESAATSTTPMTTPSTTPTNTPAPLTLPTNSNQSTKKRNVIVPTEFQIPTTQELVKQDSKECTIDRTSSRARPPTASGRGGKKSIPTVSQVDAMKWLLMAAAGVIEEVTVGHGARTVKSDRMAGSFEILLNHLNAPPATKDARGYSAVHWLIFGAIAEGMKDEVTFKPKEDPQLAKFDTGGVEPGQNEMAAPNLVSMLRYRIEPALEILLQTSIAFGYRGDVGDEWSVDEYFKKTNILDIQDKKGNTALFYAVAYQRVDLVGLLLLHGASVEIANRAGQRVFDLVQWQKAEATPISEIKPIDGDEEMKSADEPNSASTKLSLTIQTGVVASNGSPIHPLVASLDTSVYTSVTHCVERKWGLNEGLRFEQASYYGETDEGAIKRMIFQRLLLNACESGDDGDIQDVKHLVQLWQKAYQPSAGHRMFPLVYRADTDYSHPLQVAASYESELCDILRLLLHMPFSLHIQSRKFQYASLPLAAVFLNLTAIDLLLAAGFEINFRDAANGKTVLHAVTEMKTMDDPQALVTDADSAYPTAAVVCNLTRQLLLRGADPAVVDDLGNTPLHVAAHRGNSSLVSLYLQWNAQQVALKQPTTASLLTAGCSSFLTKQNIYGNIALHYGFYSAFQSPHHVVSCQLLYSTGVSPNIQKEPKNRSGQTPLQVFAAPETECGMMVCKEALKQSLGQVQAFVEPFRKRIKKKGPTLKGHNSSRFAESFSRELERRLLSRALILLSLFVVLLADLSHGLERFPIEVMTEHEVSAEEIAALQTDLTYVTANHWTPPTNPTETNIPKLDPAAITISEAIDSSGSTTPKKDVFEIKRRHKKMVEDAAMNTKESEDEDEQIVEGQNSPSDTRRLLTCGLAVPLQVRMTPRCGWGVFTTEFLERGSFVLEYVGELLTQPESERRSWEYIAKGTHPIYMFSGLVGLDGHRYSVDPNVYGSVARFINHSCDAVLECRPVLDRTHFGLYALCDIEPFTELTLDYKYEPTETGAILICHCGETNCDRTLL